LLWRVFIIHLRNFLSLRGVLTLVSCLIVALIGLLLIARKIFVRVSNFRVFTATDVLAVDYSEIMTYF